MFKEGKYYGWIYQITNIINNKIYIGQTRQNIKRRWSQHISNSKFEQSHSLIDQAIKKYGKDNFSITEIDCIITDTLENLITQLNEKEKYYIIYYKSSVEYNNYNITAGGEKISISCLVPIDKYDFDGNLLKEYSSFISATNDLGLDDNKFANISACCNGRRRSAYGFIWRYHNHSFKEYPIYSQHLNNIPIDEYDEFGNLICSYDDIYNIDGCKNIKIRNYIYSVCKGEKSRYHNKIYRYKGESFDKFPLPQKNIRNAPINCYSIKDEYICTYENSTNAAIDININSKSIVNIRNSIGLCLRGKKDIFYNYKWYYASDPNQPDKSKIIV